MAIISDKSPKKKHPDRALSPDGYCVWGAQCLDSPMHPQGTAPPDNDKGSERLQLAVA